MRLKAKVKNSRLASHTKASCTFIDKFHDNGLKPIIIRVNQFARDFQEDKNSKVDSEDHAVVGSGRGQKLVMQNQA